jgi:hypothetical protein
VIALVCALVAVALGLAALYYRREMLAREAVIDELHDRLRSERREDGAVIARERDIAEGRAREIVRLREQIAAHVAAGRQQEAELSDLRRVSEARLAALRAVEHDRDELERLRSTREEDR